MVKITSFLLASVAIFAVSTQAQVSLEPIAKSTTDLALYHEAAALADGGMNILPYPAPHNSGSHKALQRRATTKKSKKPSVKLTKDEQSILDTHNKFRALHQAPPLTWNAKLAAFGNNHLKACEFKHSGGPYGENLAAGYKDYKTAITAWYNEVKSYNYNRPGFSGATGHFTQVVWKATTQVGCAKRFCQNSNWTIYICEYSAPGNIVSPPTNEYFRKNVLPPKKK
ncbi:hypothetical protein EMPS_07158 [Entomortierella parvispora]|uniref:SCP domain-containing protein n=1 Tax=Entomortierella parvispora TaxID=205924 RepID=A0A9P3LYE9_9FUNG|nr:hypothetical protein EMPS_07158 [Entomortierella parvispora]